MPLCSVIVVNWNGRQFLEECLSSLRKQSVRDFEIILVDNASTDGSAEFIAEHFPEVVLLTLGTNAGFCAANNIAIRDALSHGAKSVLLLNNDTFVAPDCLDQMFRVMDQDPRIAAVCPKIFCAQSPHLLWYAGAEFSLWTSRSRYTGWHVPDVGQYETIRPITQATGCAMLVRASAIESVGLLNENYWAYVEDLEWSLRFAERGWKIMFAPQALVWHFDGGTAVRSGSQFLRQYFITRNLLLLCWERVRWWQLPTFLVGFLCSHVMFYSLLRLLRGDSRGFRAIFRGVADSLRF